MSETKAELWTWTKLSDTSEFARMATPTGWLVAHKTPHGPVSAMTEVVDPDAPHVLALRDERAKARRVQAEDAAAQIEGFEVARAQLDAGLDADQCVSAGERSGVILRSVGGRAWSAQLFRCGLAVYMSMALTGPEARERCTAVIRAWVLEGKLPDETEVER